MRQRFGSETNRPTGFTGNFLELTGKIWQDRRMNYNAVTDMFATYGIALSRLHASLNDGFDKAIDLLSSEQDQVVVCGMGKSGLVGRKIAATLTSTGTPAFFLHPAEAIHGDLGIVRKGNIVILISNSGETEEVVRLLPAFERLQVKLIALVGQIDSTIGKAADIVLDASVDKEACPLNLAPTTSTLTALVLGDALAIALMARSGFQVEDFAATHPGGKLGQRLLTRVKDKMVSDKLPFVPADMPMAEVIIRMTEGRLGIALVGDAANLDGIITDGDLRRMLVQGIELQNTKAGDVANANPLSIAPDVMMAEAETIMLEQKVQCLVVRADDEQVCGILQIY